MDAPEDLKLDDLHIKYEGEVWALSVDFCTYIATASVTGAMTECGGRCRIEWKHAGPQVHYKERQCQSKITGENNA
jgi:hypothetical protein